MIYINNILNKIFVFSLIAIIIPSFTFAQDANSLIEKIITFFNSAITLLFVIVTFFFIFNLIKLVVSDSKSEELKTKVSNSLIILVIIVSVWGLVNIITNTLGINSTGPSGIKPAELIKFK